MDWKKYSPHIISVVVILLTSILYCSPVLQGKRLVQDDIVKNIAQAKEIREYRDANGEEPLWTTRVFSGMTAFSYRNRVQHQRRAHAGQSGAQNLPTHGECLVRHHARLLHPACSHGGQSMARTSRIAHLRNFHEPHCIVGSRSRDEGCLDRIHGPLQLAESFWR